VLLGLGYESMTEPAKDRLLHYSILTATIAAFLCHVYVKDPISSDSMALLKLGTNVLGWVANIELACSVPLTEPASSCFTATYRAPIMSCAQHLLSKICYVSSLGRRTCLVFGVPPVYLLSLCTDEIENQARENEVGVGSKRQAPSDSTDIHVMDWIRQAVASRRPDAPHRAIPTHVFFLGRRERAGQREQDCRLWILFQHCLLLETVCIKRQHLTHLLKPLKRSISRCHGRGILARRLGYPQLIQRRIRKGMRRTTFSSCLGNGSHRTGCNTPSSSSIPIMPHDIMYAQKLFLTLHRATGTSSYYTKGRMSLLG